MKILIFFILVGISSGCNETKPQKADSVNQSIDEIKQVVSCQQAAMPPKGIAVADMKLFEGIAIIESGIDDNCEHKDKWGNVIALGRYGMKMSTWNWACEKAGLDPYSREWRWRYNASNPAKCEYLINVVWYVQKAKTQEEKIRCHRFMNPKAWYRKTANKYYKNVIKAMDIQTLTSR